VEQRFGVTECRSDGATLRSAMTTGPWMDRTPGIEQAGALGVFLDHVLGEAHYLARPADHWSLTTELSFEVLVPPPWRTSRLHATSWVSRNEPAGGFVQADVTDERGTLVAIGTTWIQYVPAATAAAREPVAMPHAPAAADFASHLGVRIGADGEDVAIELRDPSRWHNTYGLPHGGIWACLAEMAAAETFARTGDLRTAHVHVSYLRPATPGATVSAVARPVRVGRSFGVVHVTGADGTGRTCVSATVTGRLR
jgi:uncharacterized protein (TIGR00369 family)